MDVKRGIYVAMIITAWMYRVAQKSKPLQHYAKIVLNRINVCQWDYISSSYQRNDQAI